MKPLRRTLFLILCLFALPAAEARRAPDLEFKDLTGQPQKIASLRGSIVVLNFWATWCAPCREELPMLDALSQKYQSENSAGRQIRFIAASANQPQERKLVDEYLHQHPLHLEFWVGADLDSLERAGLGNLLPATLILDSQGEVVARILGQARREDVEAPLQWLLNNKSGPPPAPLVRRYS